MLVPDLYVLLSPTQILAYKNKHEKKIFSPKKAFLTFFSMQLFSADAIIFSIFLPLKTYENTLKSCSLSAPYFFFTYWLVAQTRPELIFHVINMSQDASVLLSVVSTQF